jgi:hypothetical protein
MCICGGFEIGLAAVAAGAGAGALKRLNVKALLLDPQKRKDLVDGVVRFCCSLEGTSTRGARSADHERVP